MAKARDDEARFLATYDASAFPRPSVTVDVVVFTVRKDPGAPEGDPARLEVLLVERAEHPFRGRWALPGGFVRLDESLDAAAARVLEAETGARGVFLEQLYTFGAPDRDPRTRVISVAYWALAPAERLAVRPGAREGQAAFHPLPAGGLPSRLAFDHGEILRRATERLRAKLEYMTVGFELLPERFTIHELQQVYEAILGRTLDRANFRKKLLASALVEPAEGVKVGRHRPARYFTFRDRQATIFPPFRWEEEP